MSKVAFIFPGQGSQSVGMCKDLYENYACARRTFEEADEALGFPSANCALKARKTSCALLLIPSRQF